MELKEEGTRHILVLFNCRKDMAGSVDFSAANAKSSAQLRVKGDRNNISQRQFVKISAGSLAKTLWKLSSLQMTLLFLWLSEKCLQCCTVYIHRFCYPIHQFFGNSFMKEMTCCEIRETQCASSWLVRWEDDATEIKTCLLNSVRQTLSYLTKIKVRWLRSVQQTWRMFSESWNRSQPANSKKSPKGQ